MQSSQYLYFIFRRNHASVFICHISFSGGSYMCIAHKLFIPLYEGGRTAKANSRRAAGRYRSLPLAGCQAVPCHRLDAAAYLQRRQAPPRRRRGKVAQPGPLDAVGLSVSAAPDLTHFPAPSAWGAGPRPPTVHRRPGARLSLRRRSTSCLRFHRGSPAVCRPCGHGAVHWAAAESLAPPIRRRRFGGS